MNANSGLDIFAHSRQLEDRPVKGRNPHLYWLTGVAPLQESVSTGEVI